MNDIKLIIWDLDDTLWQGTLAEKEAVVLDDKVVERIHYLLGRGIVHSICSKNDALLAEEKLQQLGLYDLFIFPKISFENKGLQIKKIIEQAQLRPQNVLFIDDNEFVLREARFHNPHITTKLAEQFMLEEVDHWGKDDKKRERLAQYKILEKKEKNKGCFLSENKDELAFLKACNISIQLNPLAIDDPEIERIIELVNRANQMNFTQSRIKYEYLFTLFELKNGINFKVRVTDDYGDYGVVGYVCVLNNNLLHFVFSCRILGMCVEARIYQWLKAAYPELKISFNLAKLKNTAQDLNFITIKFEEGMGEIQSLVPSKKILVRGPCLANAVSFLLNQHYQVDEEIFSFFEYANLHYLKAAMHNSEDERFRYTFDALQNNNYQMVVNFLESDYFSGNYKIQNQLVPVASNYIFWKSLRTIQRDNQLLSAHIKAMMLNGMRDLKKFNLGNKFSPWPRMEHFASITLNWFGEAWRNLLYQGFFYVVFKDYCGYVSAKQFEETVKWYVDLFPEDVQLVFINPPEKINLPLHNATQGKKIKKRTQTLNAIMRNLARDKSNVMLVEMDDVLEQEDIVDSFSHLKRQGYIKLSQALLRVANKN